MKRFILVGLGAVVVIVMLVGDGVAVSSILLNYRGGGGPAKKQEAPVTKSPPKVLAASKQIFVKIPQFVVTIPSGPSGDQATVYLQLSLSFMTGDKRAAKDFDLLMPAIKSGIISSVMGAPPAEVQDPVKMKRSIAMNSLRVVNEAVHDGDPKVRDAPFRAAYVTGYLVQ